MTGHPGDTPENALWRAVLLQAFVDLKTDVSWLERTLTRKHILSQADFIMLNNGKTRRNARKDALALAKGRRYKVKQAHLERARAWEWFNLADIDFNFVCHAANVDPVEAARRAAFLRISS